jgi:hypothetical protein
VAVAFSVAWLEDAVQEGPGAGRARELLARLREELYRCLAGELVGGFL